MSKQITLFATMVMLLLAPLTSSAYSQRKRTNQQPTNPRVLNRATAAKALLPIIKSKGPILAGFDLQPTTDSPERIRKTSDGFRLAEQAGWITLDVEGDLTIPRLTSLGRRVFEERRHPAITKTDEGWYEFVIQTHATLKQITGIRVWSGGNEAVVEYLWQWEPAEFVSGVLPPVVFSSSAYFVRYDDGWRLNRVSN